MTELGARIKQLREERGLAIEPAANMLKPRVTGKTWSKWERGTEEPGLANFRSLTKFFGVSADYLLGWTDERAPKSGEGDAPDPAAGQNAASDEVAAEGSALKADPRPTRRRRGSARRPES